MRTGWVVDVDVYCEAGMEVTTILVREVWRVGMVRVVHLLFGLGWERRGTTLSTDAMDTMSWEEVLPS
jgi:hypothetical protein